MEMADPFATVEIADAYFKVRAYSSGWTALADDETKSQYLNLASVIIRIFASFTPDDAEEKANVTCSATSAKNHSMAGILSLMSSVGW